MKFRSLVLYLALGLSANIAAADIDGAKALREGDMKKLIFHSEAKPVSGQSYLREDGSDGRLADYEGKYVLLNFWAIWCAPCRKEMPMLSELQAEMGGDDFEVVTLASGPRNPPAGITRFFEKIEVSNLPLHRDPEGRLPREMAVFGLPVTVLLDPEGKEIARLQGEADWSSDTAKAVLRTLIEGAGDS